MSGAPLPEISEREATGRVAEIYEEIRRAVGLPLVNLVYRVLAADGKLDAVWSELGPNLRDPGIADSAAELLEGITASCSAIPRSALAVLGASDNECARGRSTIAAYMHANPRNLLAVNALLEEAPGTGASEPGDAENSPSPEWDMLPMASLEGLDPDSRALLDEMSAPLVSPGEGVLVPSLLRHFAHRPALLALLWTAIAPSFGTGAVAADADAIGQQARRLARKLPYAVKPLSDPSTRQTLERFQFTLSRMIVVGRLLEQALGSTRGSTEEIA